MDKLERGRRIAFIKAFHSQIHIYYKSAHFCAIYRICQNVCGRFICNSFQLETKQNSINYKISRDTAICRRKCEFCLLPSR